jgi:Zn-dependent peptidase ImmA (M78 family)/DNA-binding XRE family transcriptional regulator
MEHETDKKIGGVVRTLRKRFGWDQRELAERAGFGHFQTVSEIERAKRSLKASEVVRLAEVFHISTNDLLEGNVPRRGQFVLWREPDRSPERADTEARFLERCRRFAFLEGLSGNAGGPTLPQYSIDLSGASYEDAESLAEEVRKTLQLGEVASPGLRENLGSQWRIKIFEDLMKNGSGATTSGEFGAAILENAGEPPTRRAFSLAHELFHLLTWDEVANHADQENPQCGDRNEKLANAFAAALLMPAETVLRKLSNHRVERFGDFLPIARSMAVSLPALLWRLVNLKKLDRDRVQEFLILSGAKEATDLDWSAPTELDRPLPERYVLLAYSAYLRGDISIGKLAELLETNVGMVEHRLDKYGLDLDADEYQAEVLPA